MTPQMMENGRVGIELMTAKAESGDSVDFFNERLQALVTEHWDDGMHGRRGILQAATGLANVASVLMVLLAEQTGQTEQEILQEVARHFHSQD